jgi:hypothetical protein
MEEEKVVKGVMVVRIVDRIPNLKQMMRQMRLKKIVALPKKRIVLEEYRAGS